MSLREYFTTFLRTPLVNQMARFLLIDSTPSQVALPLLKYLITFLFVIFIEAKQIQPPLFPLYPLVLSISCNYIRYYILPDHIEGFPYHKTKDHDDWQQNEYNENYNTCYLEQNILGIYVLYVLYES